MNEFDYLKKRRVGINDEAYDLLILNNDDPVLRKVGTDKNAVGFAFHVDDTKSVDDSLDELMRMTLQLADTEYALDKKVLSRFL